MVRRRYLATDGTAPPVDTELVNYQGSSDTYTGVLPDAAVPTWVSWRNLYNGATVEDTVQTITEAGGTVSLNFAQNPTGDVTFIFGGTEVTLTAGAVALTAGSDISPTLNYVYVTEAAGTATLAAGASWPAGEDYAPIATVLVQSAASVGTDGPYKHHAWTDHVTDSNDIGHLGHINSKLRGEPATWISGAAGSALVLSSPDAHMTTSTGVVFQLHPHAMPALDMSTDGAFVPNEPTTANLKITSFDDLSQDASGGAINNKWFSLVLWGVISENAGDCKLFINLPTGTYVTEASAQADGDNYAVYTVPSSYTGTGFLIAKYTVQGKTSGLWVESEVIDLRGLKPAISPGTGTAVTSHLALSGITTDDHHTKYTDAEVITAVASPGATDDLGTVTTAEWRDGFFSGTVYVSEVSGAASWLTLRSNTRIVQNINGTAITYMHATKWWPVSDGSVDIGGATTERFKDAHFSGTVYVPQVTGAVGDLGIRGNGGADWVNVGNAGIRPGTTGLGLGTAALPWLDGHFGNTVNTPQVAFGAGSASADVNTLDDYQEGPWSPVFASTGGGTWTIGAAQGRYQKVGNTVTAWANLYGYRGSLAAGNLSVSGLPINTGSNISFWAASIGYVNAFTFTGSLCGYAAASGSTILLLAQSNGGSTILTEQALNTAGSQSHVMLRISYEV